MKLARPKEVFRIIEAPIRLQTMFEPPVPIATFCELSAMGNDAIRLGTVERGELEPVSTRAQPRLPISLTVAVKVPVRTQG